MGGVSTDSLNRRFFDAVAALAKESINQGECSDNERITSPIDEGAGNVNSTAAGTNPASSGARSTAAASSAAAGARSGGETGGAKGDKIITGVESSAESNKNTSSGDTKTSGSTGTGSSLEFTVFDIASLPFYSQDLEVTPPHSVTAMRDLAAATDGILIVTPEYNRSIPGVLKNALDWGSRPPGTNIWARKPTAIMGAAPGGIGTFGAQQHLRNICSWLDMPVMNQPAVYFNASTGMMDSAGKIGADGDRLTESSATFMRKFLAAFESWIAAFR